MEIVSSEDFSIKQIFQNHWEDYLAKTQSSLPEYVTEAVAKMLACRDPEKLGYHKYACPHHPDQIRIAPNSCKGRFCNSCGKVFTDKWVSKIEKDFPSTPFHHLTFTIPSELRELLDKYKFLRNCLFTASSQTVLSFGKDKHFLPAIVSCLHTFGRDLKDHPPRT